MAKKKNPPDLTPRNLHAAVRRELRIGLRVKAVEAFLNRTYPGWRKV